MPTVQVPSAWTLLHQTSEAIAPPRHTLWRPNVFVDKKTPHLHKFT
jgi:hypothetical protein